MLATEFPCVSDNNFSSNRILGEECVKVNYFKYYEFKHCKLINPPIQQLHLGKGELENVNFDLFLLQKVTNKKF